MRLATWVQVAIPPIVLKHVEDGGTHPKGLTKLLRVDKLEVVRGSVILGKSPPHASHQATNRQIEARRAVLPLIITIWRKIKKFRRFTVMSKDVLHSAVNFSISTAALLVMKMAVVSYARQN